MLLVQQIALSMCSLLLYMGFRFVKPLLIKALQAEFQAILTNAFNAVFRIAETGLP